MLEIKKLHKSYAIGDSSLHVLGFGYADGDDATRLHDPTLDTFSRQEAARIRC